MEFHSFVMIRDLVTFTIMNKDPNTKTKPYGEFFNYFGPRDRKFQLWFAEKRTRLIAAIFPTLARTGVVPDTISYVGISLLAGVVLYFVRKPLLAVLFLAGHIILDGMDGAYARRSGKASQSGAFTDLVCDQLGMVVVALMTIFHHMVWPVLGAVYISLYLIVVVFGVIINAMGLGTRVTITSKYFLYVVYAIWAVWEVNYFTPLMSFFSIIMAVEVTVGYLRLKSGIRKKFDTQVRFTSGDQYSGRLNYALNILVPAVTFFAILIQGNWIPIRAMMDVPKERAHWDQGDWTAPEGTLGDILGFGVKDANILVLIRNSDEVLEIRRFPEPGSFSVPSYISPEFSTFPVDGNMLLIADSNTRLLMGVDLDASFKSGRAVMVMTLPLQYLRVTAMSTGYWNGKKVWLAANYLYTRKTYVVDPEQAVKRGFLLGGVQASYVNAGFPSGIAFTDDRIIEYNASPFSRLLYMADIGRIVPRGNLLDRAKISFVPPETDVFGPVVQDKNVLMLSKQGKLYKMPIDSVLKTKP